MENNGFIRKVQAYTGERSFTVVLPKYFASKIGIAKGDYLKVTLIDQKIIMERTTL